ncbi:hypothetical protein M407DRAFT_79749 [Tulasnella calospora MUT 4182]|uniref:Zn(2)-C6 fungal-type domain-containing protein n=1 Tax=Tulasnella calospora MUT 4182 TaxID=1051891 RepID=A0A0C3LKQ6_9AGAM|nr:hypothetical protein M407DRAFT_79749 [Tulasnella calospora MUT 4182]
MQSPTIPVLRRGEACVECRRRKLRCDGAKPNCTICLKADRKCRYEKILARPVYLVLQERLAALERRYQRLTSASPRTAILRTTMPTIQIDTPTPVQDMTGQWWEPEDLSPAIRDYLVNIFMLHRPSIHFCFHEPTFRARLASPDEAERPHRALLESIYLFACYFSSRFPDNQSLVHHEEHFLRRARQALMESLSYSDRLMDFLRGSVLLTQYLYMRGRFLEGYHVHCGAARFALSCGLHRLTSFIFNSPVYTNSNPSNIVLLQPPANGIELGERISTFWMIYMCDKLSSVVAGFVCALPSESDAVDSVETVFPRMMDEYELVSLLPRIALIVH